MKILFFGTPDIAVPFLEWLFDNCDVVGVVCRKDEPVGRGYQLTPPPTKVFAQKKDIPVFQPTGLWTDETISTLMNLNADLGVAVAYGRILPRAVIDAPKHGCLNVHFSLLPKYRGAAPMQWSLVNGDKKTGVTIFWLEEGLDTGPIFHQRDVDIAPDDDAAKLEAKLVPIGIQLLERVVSDAAKGVFVRTPQSGEPTLAPILKKEDGRIDWSQPADRIVNLTRGLSNWPGTVTAFIGRDGQPKKLKIIRATVPIQSRSSAGNYGKIVDVVKNQGILVQSGTEPVLLLDVQSEGKKPMSAWAFWQGAGLKVGDKFE